MAESESVIKSELVRFSETPRAVLIQNWAQLDIAKHNFLHLKISFLASFTAKNTLSCVYTHEHCVCEHVWKIYFSSNFRRTRGKRRTNCASSYVKIVGEIGKSSHEHGREQKFRKHGTLWAMNILCVRRKNQQETVRYELFTNPVLITQTSCSRTKCSQVYTQLYTTRLKIKWNNFKRSAFIYYELVQGAINKLGRRLQIKKKMLKICVKVKNLDVAIEFFSSNRTPTTPLLLRNQFSFSKHSILLRKRKIDVSRGWKLT